MKLFANDGEFGWLERLVNENEELTERIVRLAEFKKTAVYKDLDDDSKALLDRQFDHMIEYSNCLNARIKIGINKAKERLQELNETL